MRMNWSLGSALEPALSGRIRAHSAFRAIGLVGLMGLVGCAGAKDECIYGCGPAGSDGTTEPTTDVPTTEPADSGDSGDSGGTSEPETFEDPGDVVGFEDDEGEVFLALGDSTGDESNQDHEFLYVIVNTADSKLGYQLSYVPESTDGPPPPSVDLTPASVRVDPATARLREAIRAGRIGPATPPSPPPPEFTDSDVGLSRQEFRVRSSTEEADEFELVDATLWAVGDTVTIWVDNDWPIDWDYDCDGTADQPDPRDASGFDNCDLSIIADAIDANIYPTLNTTFGDVPDVNEDGKVTVVITPVLNAMTAFVEDEDDIGTLVRSYVDPETDLNTYDISENPLSDEQEVIFVFAPDANGFANAAARTTVEAYTQMELLAEVARGYVWLMSYKYKVLDGGGEIEDAWVLEGLSAMGADLTGFGAVYYDDVWDYLDAPNLTPLVNTEENEVINTQQWGAQYLFFRWMYENAAFINGSEAEDPGAELLAQFIQSTSSGVDNVSATTGADMSDLVVGWQVALATAGMTLSTGDPLVDEAEWPGYDAANTVSAPTSNPTSGDLYGANGYQTGFNVSGTNVFMEGGTTVDPTENEDRRVLTSGSDFNTLVTGIDFYGAVAGGYGAQVVRLADIPYDAATLRVDAEGTNYVGVAIRLENPTELDYTVENIFSSTDPSSLDLPALPTDGAPVFGYGEIQAPGVTYIVTAEAETATQVSDTDRWILDLSDRTVGEEVEVAVHVTRRYTDANGNEGPSSIWVAVVGEDAVPRPSTASSSDTCSDTDTLSWGFPSSVLDYLYYQLFLSGTSYSDASSEEDESGEGEGEGE
ncbi:MAG TPA: hypothetical protein DFR83_03355, partial [Deltaproteobacteria bacterium]|nr:hypothetical protein [Deltaproteobacteria bacterium]